MHGNAPLPVLKINQGKKRGYAVYTYFDLPQPEAIKRWTPNRKAIFIGAMREGLISQEEFLQRYQVQNVELASWKREKNAIVGMEDEPTELSSIGKHIMDLYDAVLDPNGKRIPYSEKRSKLLAFLLLREGKVVSKDMLISHLYSDVEDRKRKRNLVDVYIVKIRQRLNKAGLDPNCIQTVWGRGYQFIAPQSV